MADKDGNGSAKVEIVLSTDGGHDENADKDGGWGDKMLIDDFKKRLKMVLRGMAFLANLPYVMSLARTAGNETAKKVTADQEAKLQATAKLFTKNADFSLGMLVLEEGLAYETGQPLFASFDQYVDNRVTLGRVLKGHEMAFNAQAGNLKDWQKKAHVNNHSKVVCVDDKLLYIGSDNIYPSYNEEHGVWIDDDATIKAWKEKIWTELWDHRTIR